VKYRLSRIAALTTLLLIATSGFSGSVAKPKAKIQDPAVFTIIHAIPATFGADKVDVYSNGTLILNDAIPGSSKSFAVESGSQRIAIYPDGVLPTSDTASILSYRPVYIGHGMDVTFVAHLNSQDKPSLTLYKNMNTEPGKKRAWLTVRHVAGAPAVDVKSDSLTLFRSLTNSMERKVSLRFGTYPVSVVLAGTNTNALPATTVDIKDNKNLIVYVWGSAAKSNLQYLTQTVNTK
jgi:hypothetical protein